jgi:hypothetical protein
MAGPESPHPGVELRPMRSDETTLWRTNVENGERTCVMISCCAGAELQVRHGDTIVVRELYPDKATLYERAAQLRNETITSRSSIT